MDTDITPTPEEVKDERAMAFVRLIVSIVTIVNVIAAQFGWQPLGIDGEMAYNAVSSIAAVITMVWAWWKNNNVTEAAIAGQKVIDELKNAEYEPQHLEE